MATMPISVEATTEQTHRSKLHNFAKTFLLSLLSVIMIAGLHACSPQDASQSEFFAVPEQSWSQEAPITFALTYPDSTACYDIELAIRHNVDYQYQNLSLAIDLIRDDKSFTRKVIDFQIADGHGIWLGKGFGALYQHHATVIANAKAGEFKQMVVWQAMPNCKTIEHVTDVGIIVSPTR